MLYIEGRVLIATSHRTLPISKRHPLIRPCSPNAIHPLHSLHESAMLYHNYLIPLCHAPTLLYIYRQMRLQMKSRVFHLHRAAKTATVILQTIGSKCPSKVSPATLRLSDREHLSHTILRRSALECLKTCFRHLFLSPSRSRNFRWPRSRLLWDSLMMLVI